MMAGGGMQRGVIHGKTDPRGGEPIQDPVTPEDLAATIFTLLGVNPEKRLISPGNRPVDIVRGGNVLYDLMA
jgi:hypothetical protein